MISLMKTAVIFDKDGVILDPSGEVERIRAYWPIVERYRTAETSRSWKDYCAYHNTELRGAPREFVAKEVVKKFGLSATLCEIRPDLKRRWEEGEFNVEEYGEVQEQILEGLQKYEDIRNFPAHLVLTVLRLIEYLRVPIDKRCPPAKNVMKFLNFLVERKIPLALITENRSKRTQMELTHLGIIHVFEVVACKDKFFFGQQIKDSPGNKKDMYSALKDYFAPAQCLAIEDSESGASAAIGAGLPVLWLPGDLPLTELLCSLIGR